MKVLTKKTANKMKNVSLAGIRQKNIDYNAARIRKSSRKVKYWRPGKGLPQWIENLRCLLVITWSSGPQQFLMTRNVPLILVPVIIPVTAGK